MITRKVEIFQKLASDEITVDDALALFKEINRTAHKAQEIDVSSPLSQNQKALWIIQKLFPGNYAYHVPIAFKTHPESSLSALKYAYRELFERHPLFYAAIDEKSPQAELVIRPPLELPYTEIEVDGLRSSEIGKRIKADSRTPFDLENGSPTRMIVYTRQSKPYAVLINFHHIIFDGVSLQIFMDGFFAAYKAKLTGRQFVCPKPTATYYDFIKWQDEMLKSAKGEQQKIFWLDQLKGSLEPLDLPLDHKRPAVPTFNGATWTTRISEETVKGLKKLGIAENVTLFIVMLTTYMVLMKRFSGKNDIRVGIPVAGRPDDRFNNVIGYFLNMVVIRNDLKENPEFRMLLKQVKETVLDAIENGNYPFFKIVEELGRTRNKKAQDLFQVAFYFQNWFSVPQELLDEETPAHKLVLEPLGDIRQEGEFDLTLEVFEHSKQCELCFKYNPDLFEEASIIRMAKHYVKILAAVSDSPDQRITEIPIFSKADNRKILTDWNTTQSAYPRQKSVYHLFYEQVLKKPESTAVIYKDHSLTYRELNERVVLLTAYLNQAGAGTETLIGIFMERSLEMMVALLAVLKSGAAYVPLDPIYPKERLAYMIEDTQLSLIITQSLIKERLPETRARILCLDTEGDEIARKTEVFSEVTEAQRFDPDQLAYVIYTSGSTGRPKGVQVKHQGLTNFLWAMAREPGFSETDRMLALTTICFDIAALELYLPLIQGGAVEIVGSEVAGNGQRLKEKIDGGRDNVIQATPATWQMLLAAQWEGNHSLKILCGGEVLPPELAEKLLDRCQELWNMFGPTETTIWSSVSRIEDKTKITIGRPIANTRMYILDECLKPVPIGVPGALYIGGDGVAKGYLNRPELNRERFIADPYAEEQSAVFYNTGDLARYLADGSIDFIGRVDQQIKIRGFRVELGEIESAVKKIEGIHEAVVALRQDKTGHKMLVTFWTGAHLPGSSPSGTLKSQIKSWLPDYMVPGRFIKLKVFPLTLNRKIDRNYLTTQKLTRVEAEYGDETTAMQTDQASSSQIEPMGVDEQLSEYIIDDLLEIIAGILEQKESLVRTDTHLGEYGFDSIRFTQLSTRLTQKFQLELDPSRFYEYSTIDDIAAYMLEAYREQIAVYYKTRIELTPANRPSFKQDTSPKTLSTISLVRTASAGSDYEPIAIIGIGGKMPQSENLKEFWRHLHSENDLITELPPDREATFRFSFENDNRYLKPSGFMSDVDLFDASFFNISPREAELMDPQQRLFLETVWETIENAGYRPRDLASQGTGVFVGVTTNDYVDIMVSSGHEMDVHTITGIAQTIIPNRISFLLNFKGPSSFIDTACSSSLVAIHRAINAIHLGDCEVAIAGGVNLIFSIAAYEALSKTGMLSPDGRCKTFDEAGDGYGRGEGVGAVLLKPLTKAEADGDHIYAVIKGSAENHGGRTNSITAPNAKAQTDLIIKTLNKAGIDPQTISYIETHGTGTALGDPIEINALKNAFNHFRSHNGAAATKTGYCGIGSVKTNVGHLEASAGIAGLLKVLLALEHKELPASIHLNKINPYINLADSPFYIVDHTQPWKRLKDQNGKPIPRRAAVSSFGFGGVNAHVVLEEYSQQTSEITDTKPPCLFLLSAKDKERLQVYAASFVTFIKAFQPDLSPLTYTLQVGREGLEERVALIVSDINELQDKLTAISQGEEIISACFRGNIKKRSTGIELLVKGRAGREFFKTIMADRSFDQLAQLWVAGVEIDWRLLHAGKLLKRIPLPTYPFAKERYWIAGETNQMKSLGARHARADRLHPLVDANTSDFNEQKYTTRLTGHEFFLTDHVFAGQKILPGVAYLEMMRAAGELAGKERVVRIENIIWAHLIRVMDNALDINVGLSFDGDAVACDIYQSLADEERLVHSQGKLVYGPIPEPEYIELNPIKERCSQTITKEAFYKLFQEVGFDYGSSFKSIEEFWYNQSEALTLLKLPQVHRKTFRNFLLHPSLMEGGLQTVSGLMGSSGALQGPAVPFAVGSVEIFHDFPEICYAYATSSQSGSNIKKFNIHFLDDQGKVLVLLKDYVLKEIKPTPHPAKRSDSGLIYMRPDRIAAPVDKQSPSGTILIFDYNDTFRETLKRHFPTIKVLLVTPGAEFRIKDNHAYEIDPGNPEDYRNLLETLQKEGLHPQHMVHFWSNAVFNTSEEILTRSITSLYFLSKAFTNIKIKKATRLLYAYTNENFEAYPYHAGVGGFARSIRLENPLLSIRSLEVDQAVAFENIIDELQAADTFETEIYYISGVRYANRLREIDSVERSNRKELVEKFFVESGVYVITGGAGGLGFIFSTYLAKNYKARLVLCGRSELSASQNEKLKELSAEGARVMYVKTDVTQEQAVVDLIQQARNTFGSIKGIIHSAGIIKDALLINKNIEDFNAVLAPKVNGTIYLDKATRDEPLDFFAVFSSISGMIGSLGQCDYAYANRFMDHYMSMREKLRLEGKCRGQSLAVNWPLWQEGGMTVDAGTRDFMEKQLGIIPLGTLNGLDAFKKGLHLNLSQMLVVEGEVAKIKRMLSDRPVKRTETDTKTKQLKLDDLTQSDQDGINKKTEAHLKKILSEATKIPMAQIDAKASLDEFGIDSVIIIDLTRELEDVFGELSKTLFFEYQTLSELAQYFIDEHLGTLNRLFGGPGPQPKPGTKTIAGTRKPLSRRKDSRFAQREPAPVTIKKNRDIAIIGLSGRYPMARDLDQFWENLQTGRDCIVEIPAERFDYDHFFDPEMKSFGKTYCKWGGFIDEVDMFDSLFFNMAPRYAEVIDPQVRLFLESAWQTFEDSGYTRSTLATTKVGVYAGVMYGEYQLLGNEEALRGEGLAGTVSFASIANRVSYFFNLKGPSFTLDSMCSSSLTAIHLACQSLQWGEIDLALAGGVNISIHPAKYIYTSQLQFLARDGRCRSFGEGGSGYVPGEGVGTALLKPLEQAISDNDNIYGVIKGSFANHDGKTNAYSVPNPVAQGELIKTALEEAQIDPITISYIEAHGTGTSLGDPIEITGLQRAFKGYDIPNQFCSIGSVKSNIGHLEGAAGIAGVTKVLLQMKYKKLVPSIHCEPPNPNINFKTSPFYVQKELVEWRRPERTIDGKTVSYPRRAGISAFGAGGSNAHVIIEEYDVPQENLDLSQNERDPQILILSAKNDSRLKLYAETLATYLKKNSDLSLVNVAYTLQMGREAMPERLAVIGSSLESAEDGLWAYVRGQDSENLVNGHIKNHNGESRLLSEGEEAPAYMQKLIDNRNYQEIARLWVRGGEIDWMALAGAVKPRRITLPTYPFDKKRCWVLGAEISHQEASGVEKHVSQLHPLLGTNISDLGTQKYSSQFQGGEFFLVDHVVGGKKILPGVAYLEMARVAGELAGKKKVLKIQNVIWAQPVIFEKDPLEVQILLHPEKSGEEINTIDYEVNTYQDGNKRLHSKGKLSYGSNKPRPNVDIEAVRKRCSRHLNGETCYQLYREAGFLYGPGFQSIQNIRFSQTEVLADLALPFAQKGHFKKFGLHPSLMDGGLQSIIGLLGDSMESQSRMYLPFAIGEVSLLKPLPEVCVAYATYAKAARRGEMVKFDIHLLDQQGLVCVHLKEFAVRAMKIADAELRDTPAIPKVPVKKDELVLHYFNLGWENRDYSRADSISRLFSDDSQTSIPAGGSIVVFDRDRKMGDAIRQQLDDIGQSRHVVIVKPGDVYKQLNESEYTLNPVSETDYHRLFDALTRKQHLPKAVLHYWANEHSELNPEITGRLNTSIYSVYHLSRTLMAKFPKENVALLYLYNLEEGLAIPHHAAITGFAKCLLLENPKIHLKLIEMDDPAGQADGLEGTVERILNELVESDQKAIEIRYRAGKRQISRINAVDLNAQFLKSENQSRVPFKDQGVYLITGGAGGLGRIFASYLAQNYNARVVLSGRSRLTKEQREGLKKPAGTNAGILYIQADITKKSDVIGLIAKIKKQFGGLNGVIHSAGVLRDAMLINNSFEDFQTVLAPKISGTLTLDAATQSEPLDFFICFSSTSAVLGNFGQSAYAYANRYMDHFMAVRESRRLKNECSGKSLSINWPLWESGGMQVSGQMKALMKKKGGFVPLKADDGISSLNKILQTDFHNLMVLYGKSVMIQSSLGITKESSENETQNKKAPVETTPDKGVLPGGLQKKVVADISKILAELLKVEVEDLDAGTDLSEYGFDSILMMNALTQLENYLNVAIDPTSLIEHRTINKIADYLIENDLLPKELTAAEKVDAIRGVVNDKTPADESGKPVAGPLPDQLLPQVVADISKILAELLKVEVDDLDAGTDLSEYGFDSILMMNALTQLENYLNVAIDPTSLIEHRTISAIAEYLCENDLLPQGLSGAEKVASGKHAVRDIKKSSIEKHSFMPMDSNPGSTSEALSQKIAVIGQTCRFPQSNTPDEFWENLKSGSDLITALPENRWVLKDYNGHENVLRHKRDSIFGSFINDVDLFDAERFGISETDAIVMDPQHRILLEMTQELWDRSGYLPEEINGKNVSVWVGGGAGTYLQIMENILNTEYMKHAIVNSIPNMMTARISDFFNLKGSSQTIDTACSSSLVALHHACRDIKSGEVDLAIAGGIGLLLTPFSYLGFESAGVLSENGRCHVFDERAKGFVMGEGAGLVLLKSFDKAVLDGDQILAVISASAINNDGKTIGVTVPNKAGQKEVIKKTLVKGNISPDTISYLEAHGTGTLLGDPIEIAAATEVYREYTSEKGYCAVGSVKSNMGHLMHAAGIASFIKVILALQNRQIPPTLHCQKPHPRFNFPDSPFYPNTRLQAWRPRNSVRRAAISSFGFGGTNCHLILEEFKAGNYPGYEPKRTILAPTAFKRKRFWLGKQIVPEAAMKHFTKDDLYYKQMFQKISRGEISPEDAFILEAN